ncbi:MAG: lipoate--protein ligase family protein [Bacteroidota bacterium]
MQTDVSLALALGRGDGIPTVRVYGWAPWALSLGWNQSLDDIRTEKTESDGIDIVRRPTGGRAVLHARELTYSVVMPLEERSVSEIYRIVSQGLIAGVRRLGIHAAIETGIPSGSSLYRGAACFVSTARFEIKVDGKKIVGSAQRRYAGSGGEDVVLQHGSLLLGNDHRTITEYLVLPERERKELAAELRERSTDLETILGRPVLFEEAASAIHSGFEEAWGVTFQPATSLEVNVL